MANILNINSKYTMLVYVVFICSQMKSAYGYKYVPILNGLIKSLKHIGFWGNLLQILERLLNITAEIPSHAIELEMFYQAISMIEYYYRILKQFVRYIQAHWLCVCPILLQLQSSDVVHTHLHW